MSSANRDASWTTVVADTMLWLRPMLWAAMALVLWFAVLVPAQADTFPFPPPDTGCPPNTSCIPGGGPGTGNPGQCTPNPNGDPGCNGAGNPVDIITGNKYQREIDLAPLPGELGLHFSRHYNSNSTHRGLTGVGWRSSFEVVLVDLGSAVQIIDADGRRLTFDRHSNQPSLCVGARPEDGRVIIDDPAKESTDRGAASKSRALTYRWQRLDGSEYVFSGGSGDGHPLQSIRAASGATMTLNYLGGALDSVRDAQGRTLRFIYARPVAAGSTRHRMLTLSAIDTPVGRVSYKHDEFGRLQSAIQPNGLIHRYHYEPERQGAPHNTWALTGISVEFAENGALKTERLATYVYDARGRAVRTHHVGGDDLKLTYGPRALTTVTAADGSRTTYRHALVAGQWKTVAADGPGCKACPPSNIRYRFRTTGSQAGLLEATLRVDAQGKPIEQERVTVDSAGRSTQVERIDYIDSKPQKAKFVLRAEYRALPDSSHTSQLTAPAYAVFWRPTLVARPSVVEGREHTVAINYNMHLQPLGVTERGFSPLDSSGKFEVSALTRTTNYRYAPIANGSRLISIDGPLPGSADTTKYHYDELGRLRLIQYPIPDLQERFAYDEAGRVVWHMPTDAVERRTTFPTASQTLAVNPLLPASSTRAQRSATYSYNTRGWLVTWNDGPRSVSLTYNAEGRVVEARDAQGNRVTWNRDVAKQVEATLWFDSSQANSATPTPQRGYYRWFDADDRTVRTLVPDGRIEEFKYDAQGRLTQHTDGDGVAHLHLARRDRGANVHARIDWAPDDQVRFFIWGNTNDRARTSSSRLASSHPRLQDDFGRIVRVDLPDHGARVAQYDAADRVTRIAFADGARVDYEYDASDRMIGKSVIGLDGVHESTITFRYHGVYLIDVVDPAQTTSYRYDSAGRRTETRISLAPIGAVAATTYTVGTVFGAQNEPIEHLLADGRVMAVTRDSQTNLPTALTLKANGLQAAQPILTGITVRAFNGITRFTHGNGVLTTREHDPAGRLTALKADGILDLRYGYHAGPRIRAIKDANAPAQSVAGALDYDGFGALKSVARAERASASERQQIDAGLVRIGFQSAASVPIRDVRGRLLSDDRFAYRYDALDRLIAVHELGTNQLIARYNYNAFGERVEKTTFDANGAPNLRRFIYQNSRLVAEIAIDAAVARIEQQYVYLNGAPVAMIESNRVLAIHTDHRGAPLAMTDATRKFVWKAKYRDAWGEVQTVDAPDITTDAWKRLLHKVSVGRFGATAHGPARLNLRLPGQYADVETGLHYNLHRYYDPRDDNVVARASTRRMSLETEKPHGRGRYITPDPLGYPDGSDPYLYASADPVNKIDSLGLYDEDVHYYMTFFLARLAGISHQEALTIALAAAYIDDNPATRPLPPDLIAGLALLSEEGRRAHNRRLALYHFVLNGADPPPLMGESPADYALRRIQNPSSTQLSNLLSASQRAGSVSRCARAQFFGEFLHTYADTFSHRDQLNARIGLNIRDESYMMIPIPNVAMGHYDWGAHPDVTYNHQAPVSSQFRNQAGFWGYNELRSLEMEKAVFRQLASYSGNALRTSDTPRSLLRSSLTDAPLTEADIFGDGTSSSITGWAQQFNRLTDDAAKIRLLNGVLSEYGLGSIPTYSIVCARAKREEYIGGLDERTYIGTIIPTTRGARGSAQRACQ